LVDPAFSPRARSQRDHSGAVEIYDSRRASGKQYVGTFDTQRAARAAERHAVEASSRPLLSRHKETVASFADQWLIIRPRQKEATNRAYRDQVRPFVDTYGGVDLIDVDRALAYKWLDTKRWTLGGLRAMFSDAVRLDLIDSNPFAGLRLRGSRGRKDLDVLSRAEVESVAECSLEVWPGEIGLNVRALIRMAAFIGMRPGELYGLRWSNLDFREHTVDVKRQYSGKTSSFEVPKNGRTRTIVLTPPARQGLLALPRPVDSDALVFRAARGGPMTGRVQHYYWHPVRCRFGRPSMDFYEFRHFCASWLFNDLELPAQDVAQQLGHTDGGALVQRLYGHPSDRLARARIKQAVGGRDLRVVDLTEAERRRSGS